MKPSDPEGGFDARTPTLSREERGQVAEFIRLGPGTPSGRLLRELLRAELYEHALLQWRTRALVLFIVSSVAVFSAVKWPVRFGAWAKKAIEAGWLFAATATTIFAIFAWAAGRQRRRILDEMSEHP